MLYAKGARCDPEKECLPTTREVVIDEIVDWVNNPDGDDRARLFWLSGVAGSGKSAIAHTVARRFYEQKRLGSSFCFDIANHSDRRPDHLFSTLAADLADFDPQWKRSLWAVIKDNRALRTTFSVKLQFESFLLKTAESLRMVGPVVIVIDALDESGGPASRKGLLSILAERIPDLPANFRIILTSRPETDIHDAFDGKLHIFCKRMETIDEQSTRNDITLFIRSQLSGITSLDRRWPGGAWCRHLVDKSEGLFQWASTACLFVNEKEKSGWTPSERFDMLLFSAPQSNNLDSLYSEILKRIFQIDEAIPMDRFKGILGTILAAKEPLPISALRELCLEYDPAVVELIIRPLGSLLSGVSQQSAPVRPLHTSFRDFLTNEDRSGPFYVDISSHNGNLALASLRVMKGLCFNICQLETSHVYNSNVSAEVASRIERTISTQLSYSCRFWADHLQAMAFEADILDEIKEFMHKRLLYWLEVLSLIKAVDIAPRALSAIREWSRVSCSVLYYVLLGEGLNIRSFQTHDEDTVAWATDAGKFIATFGSAISQSAPHIYLSAVPFAPKESIISKLFLPEFSKTLSLRTGKATNWPAIQNVLEQHTDAIFSVAFSQDGKRIVSGSGDKMIRVWDAETGNVVSGPFEGHTSYVSSVAFSQDGKHIVSGSNDKTIWIWGAEMGNVISGPFEGHTGGVRSVTFSPDSKHIISGSDDKTIRVWDAETGDAGSGPFEGHTSSVNSVASSPDGKRIVSGSDDHTIRVWDAETGNVVSGPFEGHTSYVCSVAFSQNGKHIVSGSSDYTIRVWDAETGNVVSGPFEGHTGGVRSVMFSQDGKRIVSGSNDMTIRIWDAETGDLISGPFEGHTDRVNSVACSQDAKRIVSGSWDKTVRVWDTEIGDVVSLLSGGHAGDFVSVVFSQDGKRIVSGSSNTVRVWDAKTGDPVSGPFEGHTGDVMSVASSQDGKRIVSGSSDQTIRVWDARTGDLVSGPFKGHTRSVMSVAFSQDGKRIVSGSSDHTIRVWDAKTPNIVSGLFEGHTDCVLSVAFSQDGRRIVSGSWDKTIRVWDAETGNVVSEPFEGHTNCVQSVVFSQDGKRIASGSWDKTIRIWDAETHNLVSRPFEGHTDRVWSVAFSQDSKRIISGSEDRTIRIWDAETGDIISGPFRWHTDRVNSVAFSQDGEYAVSGSDDRTIRVWDADLTANIISKGMLPPLHDIMSLRNDMLQGAYPDDFKDTSKMDNGWMLGLDSELLFWVPPWNRVGLWWPRTTAVIAEQSTKLDFSQFVHGTAWYQCKG
jgi:WD40 repeat protein